MAATDPTCCFLREEGREGANSEVQPLAALQINSRTSELLLYEISSIHS